MSYLTLIVWNMSKHKEKQEKHVFQDSLSISSEIRKMYLSKILVLCVDMPCVLVFWWICTDVWEDTSTFVDNVRKPINAHKRKKISYITNTVCHLHIAATRVAIFRDVIYRGKIYGDVTSVAETCRRHIMFTTQSNSFLYHA